MRHIFLTTLASLLAVGSVATATSYLLDRPTVLRVAVPRKSEDFRLMGAFQHSLQQDGKNIRFTLVPVDDFAATSALLEKNEADVAVVRTDIAMPLKSQTLLILYREAAVLITPHGSKITSITALKGSRIGVLRGRVSAPGNAALLGSILAQYNIAAGSFSIVEMVPEEAPKALAKKEVDAIFAVGVPQSPFLADTVKLVAGTGSLPNFIPVTQADLIANHSPGIESLTIVAGTFGGAPARPAEDFETASVSVRLMATSTMADAVAANVLRHLFFERPQIASVVPLASRMEAPSTDKGQAMPVHVGAAAFLDGEEQSFLDRYSDYIYLGAMFVSTLGSGLAAMSTRIGLKRFRDVDDHLERLLLLMKSAREAPDTSVLNAIESEVDTIMASVLHRNSINGLQGHRAPAFTLAVGNVRAAINDRRGMLRGEVLPFATAQPPVMLARRDQGQN